MDKDPINRAQLGGPRQRLALDGVLGPTRRINVAVSRKSKVAVDIARVSQKRAPKPTAMSQRVSSIQSSEPAYSILKSRPLPKYRAPRRPLRPVKKRHGRHWILGVSGTFLALFLVMGGFLAWKGYGNLHRVFQGTTTVAALSQQVVPSQLKGEGDGRVNILLLGIGGPAHDGPDLTDTMIIMSVDPVNYTATMLSVPRDLWVKQPVNYFGNYQKINAVYESGKYKYIGRLDSSNTNTGALQAGFAADDAIIKDVLGININYHVLVNFKAFQQAINTVGGITVDVHDQLYDPTMAWENNWNPVLAQPGVQVMNGKQALLFARSRETSSDFARADRQRQIIVALKDKVLTAGTLSNPSKISGLLDAFGDNVYSDLSTTGAERLYGIIKRVGDSKISSIGLTDPSVNLVTTDHVGNISVVRPIEGFNNYTAIQQFVRSKLKDGYITKENASISVVGSASQVDQIAQMEGELKSYGYNVSQTGSVQTAALQTMVVDLSGGKAPFTRNYLEKRFKTQALAALPPEFKSDSGSFKSEFVIIVGKNETFTN